MDVLLSTDNSPVVNVRFLMRYGVSGVSLLFDTYFFFAAENINLKELLLNLG